MNKKLTYLIGGLSIGSAVGLYIGVKGALVYALKSIKDYLQSDEFDKEVERQCAIMMEELRARIEESYN